MMKWWAERHQSRARLRAQEREVRAREAIPIGLLRVEVGIGVRVMGDVPIVLIVPKVVSVRV